MSKEVKFRAREHKLFWYWINERHRINIKRTEGKSFPWTKDKILLEYKFTNVYRQLDRVTQAWEDRFVRLLGRGRNLSDGDLLFQCLMFRIFNWPETYDALYFNLRTEWNMKKAVEILRVRKEEDHEQIFTGAYIVTGSGSSLPKHETICAALQEAWKMRDKIAKRIRNGRSLREAVEALQEIPTVGPFVAYEIACDLRFTRLLADSLDRNSWANPGPGAKRGIHRLITGSKKWDRGKKPDYVEVMRTLFKEKGRYLEEHVLSEKRYPFEMREIEHSLCEFDKYMRVKNGEGRPRSRYRPPKIQEELPF